jgi:hypothetical protein
MSVPAATAWTAAGRFEQLHDGHHRPGRGEGQSEHDHGPIEGNVGLGLGGAF